MTIKKLVLAALTFLICLTILTVVFSESGLLVNRSLKKRYFALKQIEEYYEARIATLESQKDNLSREEAFDDLALSLGYNKEGEKVFYFSNEDVLDVDSSSDKESLPEIYHGLKLKYLLLISFSISVVELLISVFIKKPKSKKRKVEKSYYDDYDI